MHQLIITTGKTKGFDALLESLNDPEHILLLEKAYVDLFLPDDQTLGDVLEGDGITQDWLDELGDHGVTEFKSYREPDILRLLGLPPLLHSARLDNDTSCSLTLQPFGLLQVSGPIGRITNGLPGMHFV